MSDNKENAAWDGGYGTLLRLAIPLIFGTAFLSVMEFIDRMFLTWYSYDSAAAATPAGGLAYILISFFMGIVLYIGNFIAQYYGAGQYKYAGKFLWQGIYCALIGSAVILMISFFSDNIIALIGHDISVQKLESTYFRMMCTGAFAIIVNALMVGFFSGIGKQNVIVTVITGSLVVNIVSDYLLIFGNFGFPRLGITGAALATIISNILSVTVYLVVAFLPKNREKFGMCCWKLDVRFIKHILKYSVSNGVQFFMEATGVTAFLLIIGRIGVRELAASNIATNISNITFMPVYGLGMAVSILVGQGIGKNDIATAQLYVKKSVKIGLAYMCFICISLVFFPNIYIFPFISETSYAQIEGVKKVAVTILQFVALYSVFDTINCIYSSAIKGAGDVHFVMEVYLIVSLLLKISLTLIAVILLHANYIIAWTVLAVLSVISGILFYLRYRSGKWKAMTLVTPELIQ
jgi:MATE family multidrug resistance protein